MVISDHRLIQADVKFVHFPWVTVLAVVAVSSFYSVVWDFETPTAGFSDLGL